MESADHVYNILIFIAIIGGPIAAVQVDKFLERKNEVTRRKRRIFETLMATRASRLSLDHVQALNMIDIEFYKGNEGNAAEKKVLNTWKGYLDHLYALKMEKHNPTDQDIKSWADKGDQLLIDLLFEMSQCLGYDFDKVDLKRHIYSPEAYYLQEEKQRILGEKLTSVLSGEQTLSMKIKEIPIDQEALKAQLEMNKKLLEWLNDKRSLRVRVDKEENNN